MAFTLTKNSDGDVSLGNLRGELLTLTPAASDYAAGGYLVQGGSSGDVGMSKILGLLPIGGQKGITPVFNPTTSKVQMYVPVPSQGTLITPGAVSAATSTNIAVASNVITVTIANNLQAGQFVLLQSFTAGGALNGLIVQVATASATQFTANYPTPNISSTADVTGTYQIIGAGIGNNLTTGTAATITNSLATSSLLTITCANTFKPGQYVILQGMTNGANANGVIVQIATSSATQFTANWTGSSFSTGADAGTASLLVTNGGAPLVSNDTFAAITNSLATASSAGTAGVITLTALQNFNPGMIVNIQGLTNGAAVNGDNLVVNQASLTQKIFVANGKTAAISTGADSGTAAVWTTGTPTISPTASMVEASPGTDFSAEAFQFLALGL